MLNPSDMVELAELFNSTVPAGPLEPFLPPGEYPARWIRHEVFRDYDKSPFLTVAFEITSGDHSGEHLSHRWSLSPSKIAYARRDLAWLGLGNFAALQTGPAGPVVLCVARGHLFKGGPLVGVIRSVFPDFAVARGAIS